MNKENVALLAQDFGGWNDIIDDVRLIEEEFEMELGPKDGNHKEHYNLAKKVYNRFKEKKSLSQLFVQGGILRKSLG